MKSFYETIELNILNILKTLEDGFNLRLTVVGICYLLFVGRCLLAFEGDLHTLLKRLSLLPCIIGHIYRHQVTSGELVLGSFPAVVKIRVHRRLSESDADADADAVADEKANG